MTAVLYAPGTIMIIVLNSDAGVRTNIGLTGRKFVHQAFRHPILKTNQSILLAFILKLYGLGTA